METIKEKALKLKKDIEQLTIEAEHLNDLRKSWLSPPHDTSPTETL